MKRVILLAALIVAVHTLLNGRYGFHRDELATFDDARHLAWGFVAYPPLTPFIARISWELFGASLTGLRFFAALAQGLSIIIAGLIARELGGNRAVQMMAAAAVAISPVSIVAGELFEYVTFDYLWWVLTAYFLIRMLKSENPRWWLGIGASVGLGVMTKYTIGVLVIAMAGGLLLTPARRYLRSPWLLGGIVIALVIVAPNLIWQLQHHLITLDFLRDIHARDVRIGRTSGFVSEQFFLPANILTIPLWLAGLYFYFRTYPAIGWTFVITFALLLAAQGRSYYLAPAYPMLLAAGPLVFTARAQRWNWAAISAGAALVILLLPLAPVNSPLWNLVTSKIDDMREEIGWPELVNAVADVRDSLPPDERASTGILVANYGEAGAIDLYGPAHGLPNVISGVNSYWLRGFGNPAPQTLIVLGFSERTRTRIFQSCAVAGRASNPYGVKNEESENPDIYVCRNPRKPWPELWKDFQHFG